MGDIQFEIIKDVNLNKIVNLDINKDVDVNVNIDDLLATAEADSEAFGEFALAEVDAYTYVREIPGEEEQCEIFELEGALDSQGNASALESLDDLGNRVAVDDLTAVVGYISPDNNAFPTTVIQNLATQTSIFPGTPLAAVPPSVLNAQTGFGILTDLTIPDPPLGTSIPNERFIPSGDLQLEWMGGNDLNDELEIVELQYELTNELTINFGEMSYLCGDDLVTGDAVLTLAEGSEYLIIWDSEVEGVAPTASHPMEIAFDGFIVGDVFTIGDQVFDLTAFVQTGDYLNNPDLANISQWEFEFSILGECEVCTPIPGTGEAFAYAESSAAIDLNNGEMALAMAEVI